VPLKSLIAPLDRSKTLCLSLSAVSLGVYGCSKIQARLSDATSQSLKYPWQDDEDASLRQHVKGAKMSGKQLFQELHGRTMAEITSRVRLLRKLDDDQCLGKIYWRKQRLIKTQRSNQEISKNFF
jgi:hypothetical protein